jgi:hypothetical protein
MVSSVKTATLPSHDYASLIIALTGYLLFIAICTIVISMFLARRLKFYPGLLKDAVQQVFVPRKVRLFEVARGSDMLLRFVRAEWRGRSIKSATVEGCSSGTQVSLLDSDLFTDFKLQSKGESVTITVTTQDNAIITDTMTVAELMNIKERKEMLGSTVFIWKLAGDINLHFQVITFEELAI